MSAVSPTPAGPASVLQYNGVRQRTAECPLQPGDEFTLFSCQVYGQTADFSFSGSLPPGRYTVAEASRVTSQLTILSQKGQELWLTQASSVYAVIGDWSKYQICR